MGLVLARADTARRTQTLGRSQSLGLPPWLCSAARVTDNSSRWIILWGDERNRRWGPEQVALPLCLKQWMASTSFQLLTKRPSPDKVQEPCLGVWWAAACSTRRITKHPSLVSEEGLGWLGSLARNEFLWINLSFDKLWKLTGAGRQSLINRDVLISRSHGAMRPR